METQTTSQKILRQSAKNLSHDAAVHCQILDLRASESAISQKDKEMLKREANGIIKRGTEMLEILAAS